MLSQPWRPARIGLLLYGGSMIVTMLLMLTIASAVFVTPEFFISIVAVATFLLAATSLTSCVGVGLFAMVPSDTGAKKAAIVAAVVGVGQLGLTGFRLLPLGELTPLVGLLSSLASLITLYAMLRALQAIGLYLREDAVYHRASSLAVSLGLLMVVGAGALCFALFSPFVAVLTSFAVGVGALFITLNYAYLVLQTASAIRSVMGV